MLSIRRVDEYYGKSHTLWDLDVDFLTDRCTMCHGPQRHRQDDPDGGHHGPVAHVLRYYGISGNRLGQVSGGHANRLRRRLCTPGPADISHTHSERKPAHRSGGADRRKAEAPQARLSSYSPCCRKRSADTAATSPVVSDRLPSAAPW